MLVRMKKGKCSPVWRVLYILNGQLFRDWEITRRQKLHIERVIIVHAMNIIELQYIKQLETLITWRLMRRLAVIDLWWTFHDKRVIASIQMSNDIPQRPSGMVDGQLFKYTNPNSILSSPTTSLLSTLQPSANTVSTSIIRWLKFALRWSGTKIFLRTILLGVLFCMHRT